MSELAVRSSDGIRLYAEVHGEGVPVVFSCAYCTTHENWRPQVDPLVRAGARVILWDYRGHGRSQVPEDASAYTIEHVVEDLGCVLDEAAPGEPAVLAGLSFGGLASLHFTLRHKERVRALALLDSGPGFKKPSALERWQGQVERTAVFLETRGFAEFLAGRAGATCVGRKPELPAARAAAEAITRQEPAGVAHFGRRIAGPVPGVIDELGQIDCPALVLVGAEDDAYLRAGEVMAARLPGATHEVVPGAGHIVNLEATEACNDALIRFLRKLEAQER